MKTVATIISHSMWKEMEIYFYQWINNNNYYLIITWGTSKVMLPPSSSSCLRGANSTVTSRESRIRSPSFGGSGVRLLVEDMRGAEGGPPWRHHPLFLFFCFLCDTQFFLEFFRKRIPKFFLEKICFPNFLEFETKWVSFTSFWCSFFSNETKKFYTFWTYITNENEFDWVLASGFQGMLFSVLMINLSKNLQIIINQFKNKSWVNIFITNFIHWYKYNNNFF